MNIWGDSPVWETTVTSQLPLRHAICLTCGWSTEPWTGTQEAADGHVATTGHTVDWHEGTQTTIAAVPRPPAWDEGAHQAPPEEPRPTDLGSLHTAVRRTWPQKSFAEGIDQLAGIAWSSDPALLAMADQAAAYVRDRALARDVRVGRRWISRRNWIRLACIAYGSAAALAAGVAVLLGHLLALGSYPVAGP